MILCSIARVMTKTVFLENMDYKIRARDLKKEGWTLKDQDDKGFTLIRKENYFD